MKNIFKPNISRFYNSNYVSGKIIISDGDEKFEVLNPANLEFICSLPESSTNEIDEAVNSAENAFNEWRKTEIRQRGEILGKIANALDDKSEELAQIVTFETGKAIRTESRVEAGIFADIFRFYAGIAPEIKGQEFPFSQNMLSYVKLEPIGVAAAIIPWNVPLMMFALKVAPCLLAGNSVVVKPSEEAPIAVMRAAEIISRFLPKGLVNVVNGTGRAGEKLVKNSKIKKVSFTGSVETGRKVYSNAAEKIIPVTLELGGKGPMIICKSANLEKTVTGFINAMRFTRQGQSCSAASRVFIHENIYDKFFNRVKIALNDLKIGDPFNESTDIGAVISKKQLDKINSYVEFGKKNYDFHQFSDVSHLKKGFFYRPTIFTNVEHDSKLAQEEIFGPVSCFFKFNELDHAIKMANDSDFGLTATIWTENLKEALRAEELEAGLVQVNQSLVVQAALPYGGHKFSGLGVEASIETVTKHFMQAKTILINKV